MSTTKQTTTPRTDAALKECVLLKDCTKVLVLRDFARQLETELTSAHATIEELRRDIRLSHDLRHLRAWQEQHAKALEENDQLRTQLEAMTKERDGMLANIGDCPACAEGLLCGSTMHEHKGCVFAERDSLRAELDRRV